MPARTRLVSALLVTLAFLAALAAVAAPLGLHGVRTHAIARSVPLRAASLSGEYFDHAVVLLMENHAICDILTTCGGKGPYETSLANGSALATNDTDCVNGSLSNYLCLTAASTFGCGGYSGAPHSNNCTWAAWNSTNLVDRIVAQGLSWQAFMENMPGDCYAADSGLYVVRHNPFVYFGDIATNASRCARVVPAGTNDSAFLAALNVTANGTNLLWLTPNLCDDMHSCSVAVGDAYLRGLVTRILASPLFTTQRSALFVTFDEPTGGLGSPYLYTVWAGPEAKADYTSAAAYNHTALEKTLEVNWGLAPLTADDSGSANMTPFFSPPADFSLTATPSSVAFDAGASATSSVQATPSNKFNGTIALTTSVTPSGVTVSCSPTTIAANGNATCTMSSSTAGSYTVTVTGTSGSLVHRATVAVTVIAPSPALGANFTVAPASPVVGQSVTFNATASGGLPPYTFAWAFGDGATGTGVTVAHAYGTAGTYTATLTAADSGGNTTTATHTVVVSSVAPPPLAADFSFQPSNVSVGASVSFTATVSGGVPPYTYSWSFGDGTSAFGSNVTHAYTTNASFAVSLTVQDSMGSGTTRTRAVSVAAVPPTVSTIPATGIGSDAATLEGNLGSLGGMAQVRVGFWYGTSPTLVGAVNVTSGTLNGTRAFEANISGLASGTTYYAEAWAEGGGFSQGGITSFTTAIGPPPPLTAGFVYAPTAPSEGQTVTFSAVVSGGVPPYTYAWSFGNGAHASGPSVNESFAAGTYNVTLTVNDTSGQRVTAVRSVVVTASPPPGDPRASVAIDGTLGNAGWYTSAATLVFNATDPAGPDVWVRVQLDGGPWANVTSTVVLSDGSHVVRYYAEDGYGAAPQPVQILHVYVDTTPPQLTLQAVRSPATGVVLQVNWTGFDNGSGIADYAASVDKDDFESQGLNLSANFTLPNGMHTITIRATDVAGNSVVENVTVQVDVPGPSPSSATTEMVAVVVFGGALMVGRVAFPKGWHRWTRRILHKK